MFKSFSIILFNDQPQAPSLPIPLPETTASCLATLLLGQLYLAAAPAQRRRTKRAALHCRHDQAHFADPVHLVELQTERSEDLSQHGWFLEGRGR